MITVAGNIDELRKLVHGFKGSELALEKATVSALNKTITSTNSFAAKKIADEYRITQKDVKKALELRRATLAKMEAEISSKGAPGIPLSDFSVTPGRVPSTIHKPGKEITVIGKRGRPLKGRHIARKSDRYLPGKGINVMIRRGSRKLIRNAFVVRLKSGHVGVFAKRSGKRLPVEELFGPSVVRILDSERYRKPIDDFAGQTMDKNMAHEAEYYLQREGVMA